MYDNYMRPKDLNVLNRKTVEKFNKNRENRDKAAFFMTIVAVVLTIYVAVSYF